MTYSFLGLTVDKEKVLEIFREHMTDHTLLSPAVALTENVVDRAFGGMVDAERYFQEQGYTTEEITSWGHQPVLWVSDHERRMGEGAFLISEKSYKERTE